MDYSFEVRVFGKVQGVWYRASTQQRAAELGLRGWVRNNLDESVTFLCKGELSKCLKLIEWAENGPPLARPTSLDIRQLGESEEFSDFSIRS